MRKTHWYIKQMKHDPAKRVYNDRFYFVHIPFFVFLSIAIQFICLITRSSIIVRVAMLQMSVWLWWRLECWHIIIISRVLMTFQTDFKLKTIIIIQKLNVFCVWSLLAWTSPYNKYLTQITLIIHQLFNLRNTVLFVCRIVLPFF